METVDKFWLNGFYFPFIWMMQYLKIDVEMLSILSALLVIDLITGWSKTIVMGKKPRSRRLAQGIIAKAVLILVPIVLALGFKAMHINTMALFYVIIDTIVLSEVYSIIGNIYTIRTGKTVEEYDVLAKILKRIRNVLNKILEGAE